LELPPTYQASAWSARDEKRIRKTFPTLAVARVWRAEAQSAIHRGKLRAPTAKTLNEAGEDLIEGMRSGRVRTKSGDLYKPSAIRSYAMMYAYRLALLYCDDSRWEDAGRCLDYGSEVPVPPFFREEAVLGLAARARMAAHSGELAEALTLARRAVEFAERSDMLNLTARVWLALAEVQRERGQTAEADATVARAFGLYEEKGNVAPQTSCRRRPTRDVDRSCPNPLPLLQLAFSAGRPVST
jgi:hypothetical protein